MTDKDKARIRLLEAVASGHEARLSGLEATVGGYSSLPVLFGQSGTEISSLDEWLTLPSPPPLVKSLAVRAKTVGALTQRLTTPRWLAIHGAFGAGKSHLGALVSRGLGGMELGVTFRGLDARTSELAILRLLANNILAERLSEPSTGTILLDDLPDFEPRGRFESALLSLVERCVGAGRIVVSTSRRRLPESVETTLSIPLIQEEVPTFSAEEAKELFLLHGLEAAFLTDVRLAALNETCKGHPLLLTVLALHMAERGQDPDRGVLDALLANKHREHVDVEIMRTVLDTVERPECRELLYRLAAINFPVTREEARDIAAVAPALPEAGGCLARLEGLWLRRTSDSYFEVSPLVTPLGKELTERVARRVHGRAARTIINRKTISVIELKRAVVSFLLAREPTSAANLLLQGFMKAHPRDIGFDAIGLLLFFPADRSSKLATWQELPLRAAQAVTAEITGVSSRTYLERVRVLSQIVSPRAAMAAVMAGSMILTAVGKVTMPLAIVGASLVEAARGHKIVRKEFGPHTEQHERGIHFLLASAAIRSWDDLDSLVELLGSLPNDRRREVVNRPEFEENWRTFVFRPLFDDNRGITHDALKRLKKLSERCEQLEIFRASAYAAAGCIVVHGEYEKDLALVRRESADALELLAGSPSAIAIIEATTGQQLVLNSQPAEGLPLLAKALARPDAIRGLERVERLTDALIASFDTSTVGETVRVRARRGTGLQCRFARGNALPGPCPDGHHVLATRKPRISVPPS